MFEGKTRDPKIQADDEEDTVESSTNPVGRPPEGTKYGTQDHVRGADPVGSKTKNRDFFNRDRSIKHTYKESMESLLKSMDKKKKTTLLSENNLLNDDSL